MKKNRKGLVIAIIVLFIGVSIIPLTESIPLDTNPPVSVDLDGTFQSVTILHGNESHDVGVEKITEPSEPPVFLDDVWIHFDNGLNTAVGTGGTYEAAIRITPDELDYYDEWTLTSVKFFHYIHMGSDTHSGNIKIYAEGDDISPGELLSVQPYTVTGHGWREISLFVPVVVDADEDLWVSVEITHAAGEYPIGVDFGPAVDGKGDWIYYNGEWRELQFMGLDYNWNIWAKVEYIYPDHPPLIKIEWVDNPYSLGITANIHNIGCGVATDVDWSIEIEGGWIFFGRYKEGQIPVISSGEYATVHLWTLGIGIVTITISAECAEGSSDELVLQGKLFWVFLKV